MQFTETPNFVLVNEKGEAHAQLVRNDGSTVTAEVLADMVAQKLWPYEYGAAMHLLIRATIENPHVDVHISNGQIRLTRRGEAWGDSVHRIGTEGIEAGADDFLRAALWTEHGLS